MTTTDPIISHLEELKTKFITKTTPIATQHTEDELLQLIQDGIGKHLMEVNVVTDERVQQLICDAAIQYSTEGYQGQRTGESTFSTTMRQECCQNCVESIAQAGAQQAANLTTVCEVKIAEMVQVHEEHRAIVELLMHLY